MRSHMHDRTLMHALHRMLTLTLTLSLPLLDPPFCRCYYTGPSYRSVIDVPNLVEGLHRPFANRKKW